VSRAWMLDPIEFHHGLAAIAGPLGDPDGYATLRAAASDAWASKDPTVQAYVGVLAQSGPEEWYATYEPSHVVEWYRALMGPYLTPTRAFRSPDLLRRRLPDLGLAPTEARRLANGRELQRLVECYAQPDQVDALVPHMSLGAKGWLDQDDVDAALTRLRALDREVFRDKQELVPLVENAYEVLEAAATKPDHVLLLVTD
jgi:hypothetical protein